MRWISQLNGNLDYEFKAREIRKEIKNIRKEENSLQNRKILRDLYNKLDEIQFVPDYMCVIMDKKKDYRRAVEGFIINGVRYVRLLGTNGGIKMSTIVFVSDRLAPELRRRIENGRDSSKELVPAKLEAYKALVCSGSIPVSPPKGIAVVNDCETVFKEDVISLSDADDGEPEMKLIRDFEITLNASDGFGMMLPSLADRWSEELNLDYRVCGVNLRYAWTKGMIYCFDFLRFADEVAGTRIIKDAWGNEVNLTNVEMILTTSQLKLWDSYESCDSYIENCNKNYYTPAVSKTTPKALENEHNLNYQFIQSYNLSDKDIEDLIAPTVKELHDIISLDWRKAILFLKGINVTEHDFARMNSDFATALMIEPSLMDDKFVRKKIIQMIKRRINDAKVGVISVHGNYAIASGDPYSLCQSMFGMEITGILKAGYIYSKYWLDEHADEVVCFRAPMTCANNIRKVKIESGADAQSWYEYMDTCVILNSWDSVMASLNGIKCQSPR